MDECELAVALLAAFLGLSLLGNAGLCWLRRRKQQEENDEAVADVEDPPNDVLPERLPKEKPPLRSIVTPPVGNLDHYVHENERLATMVKVREREKQDLWNQLQQQQRNSSNFVPASGESLFTRARELLSDPQQMAAELDRLESIWNSRDERYAKAMKEITDLRNRSDPLTNKLVSDTITGLQSRDQDQARQIAGLTQRLSASDGRHAMLEGENAKLKKELLATKQKHKTDFQQLLDELTGLQIEYGGKQATQTELAASQREAAVLRSQLQQERDNNEDANLEIERLRSIELQHAETCDKMRRLESELSTRPILTVPSPARPQQPLPTDTPSALNLRMSVVASPRRRPSSPLLSSAELARLAKPSARSKRHPLLELSPTNHSDVGKRTPIVNPLDGW